MSVVKASDAYRAALRREDAASKHLDQARADYAAARDARIAAAKAFDDATARMDAEYRTFHDQLDAFERDYLKP